MKYRETKLESSIYRREYLESLNALIDKRALSAQDEQNSRILKILKNPETYRKELKKMLGWPLTDENCDVPNVTRTLLSSEEFYNIYRLKFELLCGLKFYGLFFEQKCDKPLPLVITQNGFLGTPELASGFFGDTSNYNDMVQRVLSKGVNVFAPQLLLWNSDNDVSFDRVMIDSKLKQLGSSIAALEVFEITKSIDYFITLDCVDENRIGMVGLSYGGFYTMFTAAVDTRIKAALSCSFYNNRYNVFFADWTWFDSGYKFTDNEIAALIYPRKLFIEVGKNDETFEVCNAQSEFEKLSAFVKDNDWISFKVFDGKHEFYKGNDDIDSLINILKF